MSEPQEFYQTGVIYTHQSGYTAKYTGRGYKNKHTYEVVNPNGIGTWKAGDRFTPNSPELYFTVKTPAAGIDLSKYHNQRVRATSTFGREITGKVVKNGADNQYYLFTNSGVWHQDNLTNIEPLTAAKLGRPRLPASERRTPRTAHLTNANWSILEERYGNVTKALEYLLTAEVHQKLEAEFQQLCAQYKALDLYDPERSKVWQQLSDKSLEISNLLIPKP